ncbi:MAG: response regulator [Desulfobacteraceae bacterium]|nr:MAG: response regulator [Desulfobacteraceae bacterium]
MIEKKILFVDDEESQRDIMRRVLRKMGYSVTLSSGPVEALEILKKEYFPLIITDLSMPGMDGTKLCKRIRSKNQNSIIYALSGFIESYQAEKLEEVGFDGYLRKPATTATIKQAVDGAFDKLQRLSS